MVDNVSATVTLTTLSCAATAVWDDIATSIGTLQKNGVGNNVATAATLNVPSSIHHMASAIPPGGQITSALIQCNGFIHMAAGALSTQAGAVSIQRYFDRQGLLINGAAVSTNFASNAAVADASDGKVCQSFTVTITNTSATWATISSFGIILLSQ